MKQLDHYIFFIMAGCALLLSILFSIIVYLYSQNQAQNESDILATNLMATVKASASAAVFSGNEAVGQDAINGLLSNESIYSVQLQGFADESTAGMMLTGTNPQGGRVLNNINMQLKSPFDDSTVLGVLTVTTNEEWVISEAAKNATDMIIGLVIVIFSSCFLAAQIIKTWVSKPLVSVVRQLDSISPDDKRRLKLPAHLRDNEIGSLVKAFNGMLEQVNTAIRVERHLRHNMEEVQERLEKAKEEAEQATAAKSNFLATMSHEIRTPMNSIIGFLELAIEQDDMGPETQRHLQIAYNSARVLLQLISDVLDVSKIESGKIELEIRPFDLAALLSEVRDLMEIKAREKRLSLDLSFPPLLAKSYMGDQFRIRQILLNLVGNAIKFTPQGKVAIELQQQQENLFQFAVVDTGIGIAEDKISQILEPFTQVDASVTREFGGTGLGTTISSELVQLMGGELKIESTLGKGSSFFFVIELPPCDKEVVVEAPQEIESAHIEPMDVLVVDDVEENIALAKTRLENEGHRVTSACNGLEALQLCQQKDFSFVLMDIQMPEMDGYDATREIRKLGGHNAEIPIVAMTASALVEERDRIKQAGMDDLILKPVNFQKLFNLMARIGGNPMIQIEEQAVHQEFHNYPLIDFVTAVDIWQDEHALYKALHSFSENNKETHNLVSALLDEQDTEELKRAYHKLRGSAANLGLKRLTHIAQDLEMGISNSTTIAANDELTKVLRETLKAIDSLPAAPELSAIVSEVVSEPGACKAALEDLMAASQQHDPDLVEMAFDCLSQQIESELLVDIKRAIDNFDFDGVGQLAAKLQLSMIQGETDVG